MIDRLADVDDLEAPGADAFEQSLPVVDPPDVAPTGMGELVADDLEVPETDAIEQHQPAVDYDDDSWR